MWFQAAVLMTEALVTLRDLGYEAWLTVMLGPGGLPGTRAGGLYL